MAFVYNTPMNPPLKFDITPTQQQLDAIERELSFRPADASASQTLSADRVEQFNGDGYLKNLRIFSAGEIDAQRSYFDELLERVVAEGGDSYSISSAHLTYGPVHDLLTHPQIVARVCDSSVIDCLESFDITFDTPIAAWGADFGAIGGAFRVKADGAVVGFGQSDGFFGFVVKTGTITTVTIDTPTAGR